MADSRRRTARLHAGSRPEPPGMGAMRARKVARTRNAGGPLARVPASSARERLWRSGRRRYASRIGLADPGLRATEQRTADEATHAQTVAVVGPRKKIGTAHI